MPIWEYLKHPQPWINLTNYTLPQVIMFFIGSLLWLVVYANVIIHIRRNKEVGIPVGCVLTNFGWEIATCLFFVPDMGKLLVVAYWGWVIFDSYIFASTFKYGHKQMMIPYFRKNVHFFIIIGILISFSTQATYMVKGFDIPMAPISGDIINLYMSAAFLYMLFIPTKQPGSLVTAWCKFLGTGIINVMFYTKYPDNYFLVAISISIAILDVLYIVLLYKKKNNTLVVS